MSLLQVTSKHKLYVQKRQQQIRKPRNYYLLSFIKLFDVTGTNKHNDMRRKESEYGSTRRRSVPNLRRKQSLYSDDGNMMRGASMMSFYEEENAVSNEAINALDDLLGSFADEWKADDMLWTAEQEQGKVEWEGFYSQKISKSAQPIPISRKHTAIDNKQKAEKQRANAEKRRIAAEEKLRKMLSSCKMRSISRASRRMASVKLSVSDELSRRSISDMGITLGPGLVVTGVMKDSIAGDIPMGSRLLTVNGRQVSNITDVEAALSSSPDGKVSITISKTDNCSTTELPRICAGLFITPPIQQSQAAGWYNLVLGHSVGGFPVWERETEDGSRWYLYSTPDRRWAIASSPFDMSNNTPELITDMEHLGKDPTTFSDTIWMTQDNEMWIDAGNVRVVEHNELPPFSTDMRTLVVPASKGIDTGISLDDNMNVLIVQPGSLAELAGITPGSKLLAVDGTAVNSQEEAMLAMKNTDKAFCVTVKQHRGSDLPVSLSMCPNTKSGSDSYCIIESQSELRDFGDKIVTEWHGKSCSILEELAENLIVPNSEDPMKIIAEAAVDLHRTKGGAYPDRNMVELLVMGSYTMAGPDIDSLLKFDNVPIFESEAQDEWNTYCMAHKNRNGAVFGAINWAGRTAVSQISEQKSEAWGTIHKWVKYLGLLLALCSDERGGDGSVIFDRIDVKNCGHVTKHQLRQHMRTHPAVRSRVGSHSVDWDEGPGTDIITRDEFLASWKAGDPASSDDLVLARGITGLPDEVYNAHKSMAIGSSLHWPAPSSCAVDPSVSEAYIRGDAANANKKAGKSILFRISGSKWGLPLQSISKYPKEAELLLPPLTSFTVQSIGDGAELDLPVGTLVINLKCVGVLGGSSLVSFSNACKQDALQASMEIGRVLAGGPQHGPTSVPPGTPVEVRTQGRKAIWYRATVVSTTDDGLYQVEWPDFNAVGGIQRADIHPTDLRVLPVSEELHVALLEGSIKDNTSNYVKRIITLQNENASDDDIVFESKTTVVKSANASTGLLPGSKIISINGTRLHSENDFRRAVLNSNKDTLSIVALVPAVAEKASQLETELQAQPMIPKHVSLKLDSPTRSRASTLEEARNFFGGVQLTGTTITSVTPNSEAEQSGLTKGCRISEVAGIKITRDTSREELIALFASSSEAASLSAGSPRLLEECRMTVLYSEASIMASRLESELKAQPMTSKNIKIPASLSSNPGALDPAFEHAQQFLDGLELVGTTVISVQPNSGAEKFGFVKGCRISHIQGDAVHCAATEEELIESLSYAIRRSESPNLIQECNMTVLFPEGREQSDPLDLTTSCVFTRVDTDEMLQCEEKVQQVQKALTANASSSIRRIEKPNDSTCGSGIQLVGTTITSITRGSVAEAAGLRPGQVIVSIAGQGVKTKAEVESALSSQTIMDIEVLSPGKEEELQTLSGLQSVLSQRSVVMSRSNSSDFGLAIHGLCIVEITPESPASESGITQGSIILSINGESVTTSDDVVKVLSSSTQIHMTVLSVPLNESSSPRDIISVENPNNQNTLSVRSSEMRTQSKIVLDTESNIGGNKQFGVILQGTTISSVTPGSAAERAGLVEGTTIQQVNGEEIHSEGQAARALAQSLSKKCELVITLPTGLGSKPLLTNNQIKELQSEYDNLHYRLRSLSQSSPKREKEARLTARISSLEQQLYQATQRGPQQQLDKDIQKDKLIRELKIQLSDAITSRDAILESAHGRKDESVADKETVTRLHASVQQLKAALESLMASEGVAVVKPERGRSPQRSTRPAETLTSIKSDVGFIRSGMKQIRDHRKEHSQSPSATTRSVRKTTSTSPGPGRRIKSKTPPSRSRRSSMVFSPHQSTAFPKFGLSLSESIHVDAEVISYVGLRVVHAAPPASPFVKTNDVVTFVGSEQMSSFDDFRRAIELSRPGEYISLTVRRRTETGLVQEIAVKIRASFTAQVPGTSGGTNSVTLSTGGGSVTCLEERFTQPTRRDPNLMRNVVAVEDPLNIFKSPNRSRSSSRSPSPRRQSPTEVSEESVDMTPARVTQPERAFLTPTEYIQKYASLLNSPPVSSPLIREDSRRTEPVSVTSVGDNFTCCDDDGGDNTQNATATDESFQVSSIAETTPSRVEGLMGRLSNFF